MNRGGWLIDPTRGRQNVEPESLFVMSAGLEISLGTHATLAFSTGVSREVSWTRFEQSHVDSGVVLTLMPAAETWLSVGAFERWDLVARQPYDLLTASFGSRLWELPVTFNVDSWVVLGNTTGAASEGFESAAVDTSLAWQISNALWSSIGLAWNAEGSESYEWATWCAYARLCLQTSPSVSYSLQLCQARFSSRSGFQSGESQNETRVRLSRSFRVTESFSTEMSVEYAIGASSRPADAPPAFCLVAQISF
jgi:hypothetical protein